MIPSVLESIVRSFYSLTWYRTAAREWPTRRAFQHLVTLLALTWSVVLVKVHRDLVQHQTLSNVEPDPH